MATIKEVAQRAGVAPASVTRVLNDHPNVSDALRKKVMAAVEECGYRPDLLAASLRRGYSRTVGVMVGDIINPLLAESVDVIETELRMNGYGVLLANSHGDPAQDVENVTLLRQRRMDGLIAAVVDERQPELAAALEELAVPVVLLDRQVAKFDRASAVLSDHRRGTLQLTRHLLDAGHHPQDIVYLSGPKGLTYSGNNRLDGFVEALRERGHEPAPNAVRHSRPTPGFGQRTIAELLDSPEPPTAVITGPNPILEGVLTELRRRGLRAGHDLALCCCDDVPIAVLHDPPITTLSRDIGDAARHCAALLLAQLTGTSRYPRTVVLPTELQVRESTTQPATAIRDRRASRQPSS